MQLILNKEEFIINNRIINSLIIDNLIADN